MSDQEQKPAGANNNSGRSLSEISHLFLSSIRDKQTGSAPRPQRTPPRTDQSIDLTPEEFAQVFDEVDAQSRNEASEHIDAERMPPVTAVIAAHLNGRQVDRVREYAAHLCKSGERVGVIELDASEFRLSCFELGSGNPQGEAVVTDLLDGRRMTETLEEMNWDVDRWLLHLPSPRATEARHLLRSIDRWTVLATCDHDGVVSCYRTLKGLSDLHPHSQTDGPTLSLSLLDAHDELLAMRVFRKLSGVCQQFLRWPLESEAPVEASGSVVENQVLTCRATRDKAQLASAPQWQVVADFLARCRSSREQSVAPAATAISGSDTTSTQTATHQPATHSSTDRPAQAGVRISPEPEATMIQPVSEHSPIHDSSNVLSHESMTEVIDLPAGADSPGAIVSATLRGNAEMVECPVKPPMLSDSTLAVARDRRLVLLAVARQGLSDLRAIGEAYRWMNENRALIAMAVPQLSIDAHQLPHLRLLIDRADLSASTLQPLLQSANVSVQTYRKLRWGPKTGLLLEAA